jgi:alkanesulfonate monooxygenase SsuD/methylene tetrahydromethanopterin reductase-like flavin-dependent oxidoreductase (luciferase family)
MAEDGRPAQPGLIPTLEQSIEQKIWIIGSPEQVAEGLQHYIERLPLTELCVVPAFPGDSYDTADEQMTRISEEVLPLLAATPAPVLEKV